MAREEGSFVGVVGECAEHRHHCEKQYASPSSLRAQLIQVKVDSNHGVERKPPQSKRLGQVGIRIVS